ncbi:Rieske 2Fe-2S domain-containing protein [Actinomadura scrupuli]|uniref:Rieske (2Fe-2S) protein n=1 Tax=Actinomadura scrupuli TaxID=559629 RepID=UPI003D972EF6
MRQESAPDEERSAPASAQDGSGQVSPVEGNSRRGLLMGVGLVGAAGVLSACGGSEASGSADGGAGSATEGAQSPGDGTQPAKAPAAVALGKTSSIPVGGGRIFKRKKIVVTQPAKGVFKAFSAVCTHRGCSVGSVSGGTINCPCHGSKFKISDASVTAGPAKEPLAAKKIKVKGGEIHLA